MTRKTMKRVLLIMIIVGPFLVLGLHAETAKAISSQCGSWNVVKSPNRGPNANDLVGVTAITASDIWAVGSDFHPTTVSDNFVQTLIEQWNGSGWSVVPSPNPGSNSNYLNGITALSASDIWAVGAFNNIGSSLPQTLVEHWDGSVWSVVASPNPSGQYGGRLNEITAVSADNIWAVGDFASTSGLDQTLIEHWDGSTWSIVSSPSRSLVNNSLTSVAAITADDIWAVGYSVDPNHGDVVQTLIEHWDGSAWSIVPSPNPGTLVNELYGATALSTNEVWAVGSSLNTYGAASTLIEQWNGTTWSVVPSPNPSANSDLISVSAITASDIWAVGFYYTSDQPLPLMTLIEQWNGTTWSIVPSPNPDSRANSLYGVTGIPGTQQAWSVGQSGTLTSHTLTESYC